MMKLPRAFSAPFFFFLGLVFYTGFLPHPYTTPKLMVLFSVCVYLVYREKLTWRGQLKYLPILLLWPLASLLGAADPVKGLSFIAMSVLAAFPLLFFIHPAQGSKEGDATYPYKKAVFSAAFLVSAHGLLGILLEASDWRYLKNIPLLGSDSLMGNPWLSAHFSVLALWFMPFNMDWGLLLKKKEAFKWRYAVYSVIIIYIVFSGSKTAILGLFLWSLSQVPKRHLFSMKGFFLVTIMLAAGSFWWSKQPEGFLKSIHDPEFYLEGYDQQSYTIVKRDPLYKGKTHSIVSRIILFKNTLEMIKAKPFIGFGAGQFEIQYPRFSQSAHRDPNMNGWYRPISPHNFILANSVELGLFWSVFLLGLMIKFGLELTHLNHRIAWLYFMVTAMLQPLYLCYPLLFIFLLAPSRLASSGFQRISKMGFLIVSCLSMVFWLSFQVMEGSSYIAQTSQDISEVFPFRKAQLLYQERDIAKSHLYFKKALKTDPYSPEALYNFLQTMSFEKLNLKKQGLELFSQAFPYFRASCVSDEMRVKEKKHLSNPVLDLRGFLIQNNLLEDKK